MNTDRTIVTPLAEPSKPGKLGPGEKVKLEKAVREFESVFVGYILKGMRNTIEKADNSNDGFGTDLLAGMFDMEFAKHISKSSNLGLARMLYKTMTGENIPAKLNMEVPHLPSPHGDVEKQDEQNNAVVSRATAQNGPKSGLSFLKSQVRQEPLAFLLPKAAVRDAVEVAKAKAVTTRPVPQSLATRLNGYSRYIAEASEKHGVSESLLKAVIAAESHGKEDARSPKDAKGLMQLVDSTAAAMGVKNVWDPRQNILGGAKYLAYLLEQFDGDEKLALAGYNAGPANVVKHGGVPPFKETKQYVTRVLNFVKLFEGQGGDDE